MRESFRQQFINCNLNNQFSLFFVLASKVESVQSSKLTYLKNVDFLGVEDILFANFNKLFINKPVLMQTVTYLHEAERNESRTSIKKFKNIRIKLAAMSFLNFDSNFLLHLAFI